MQYSGRLRPDSTALNNANLMRSFRPLIGGGNKMRRQVRLFVHYISLFSVVAFGTKETTAGKPAEDRMTDIVRNVRANEELYKDREVLANYKYELGEAKHLLGGYGKSTEGDYRIVMQKGLSYAKVTLPQPTLNGGKGNANTLQGWDGLVTRAVEQDAFCNLIKGERADDYRYYLMNPHTVPLWRGPSWLQFPLADYLTGGAAVKSKKTATSLNVKALYMGEDIVNDLNCMKVRCFVWADGFKEPVQESKDYHDIWLATDRNYVPILVKLYVERMGDIPIEIRTSGDFRELESGIWYPHRFDVAVNDDARYIVDKTVKLLCHETYLVKKVDLHPNYDISLFRDIEFPKYLPLYTIENGEIVEHRKAALTEKPQTGMSPTALVGLIATGALLMLITALLLVGRAKNRVSDQSLSSGSGVSGSEDRI